MRNEFVNPVQNLLDNGFFNDNNNMKTDIIDNGDTYEVNAELAGFDKDDIHMDYRDNTLSINAKKNANHDEENGKVVFSEISSNDIKRSFYLPNVDIKKIQASYENGILNVVLPKVNVDNQGHSISID
ncbi:Hsp20/alpha crystallin family protein [Apilactobacillus xinyiensis]|uniref:Hsp20/alpha crystallin family protein n=1 Tax=Apilactobacillus xinyiensis TaxID=2841032 RepID=A0ABT0I2M3_9LACO|nr:Hsp20/alpha crystallin family protein [Apilactobacillus xinyiensis]MCK8624980.1 Hsp20/alpha crystallin family protein [Apilactobacillus xinyiensis]MCL0330512.1 Hsp20/alpha crystallin family protein [Apilactobacillus xinyiensis]